MQIIVAVARHPHNQGRIVRFRTLAGEDIWRKDMVRRLKQKEEIGVLPLGALQYAGDNLRATPIILVTAGPSQTEYIRTKKDSTEEDNLGSLRELPSEPGDELE